MSTVQRVLNILSFAFLFVNASSAFAQPSDLEVGVKAGFIINFARFTDWPTEASSGPLVIATIGADKLAAELERVSSDRTVSGRPIRVRRLEEGQTPTDLHMLVIGEAANDRIASIATATRGPVLIVSAADDGLRRGAVINFVVVNGRIRFEVNAERAQQRNLRLSSRMIAVALPRRPLERLPMFPATFQWARIDPTRILTTEYPGKRPHNRAFFG